MATTVGALSVDLDLNSAAFINNMKRTVDSVERGSRSMQSALGLAKTAAAGFLGGFAISSITNMVNEGLEFAASLGEQAQQLGVTTRELQVYRYAASQVGIANEDMDKVLAKLTLSIGKAAGGNKELANVFGRLGIAITDTGGHTRATGDVFEDLADRMQKMPEAAKRSTIEVALMGKAAQIADTLLTGGSRAIDEFAASADHLGLVLDDKLIQQADTAADKLAEMEQVLKVQLSAAVAENAQEFVDLAGAIEKTIVKAAEFFTTMRGFAKMQRDEGAVSAFFNPASGLSWSNQLAAADPKGYVKLRGDQLNEAKAALAKLNRDFPNNSGGPFIDANRRAAEGAVTEARRLWNLAKNDPDYIAAMKGGGALGGNKPKPGTPPAIVTPESEAAAKAAAKLSEEYERQSRELENQLKVELLRRDGANFQADLLQSEELLRERFIKLDGKRLDILLDQNFELERMKASAADLATLLADTKPLKVADRFGIKRDILDSSAISADLKQIEKDAEKAAKAAGLIRVHWEDAAHGILSASDNIVQGLTHEGGIIQALEGVLDLFLQLGSIGVFGSKLQTNIKAGLSGQRANGGMVGAGGLYLVGERGPELFAPGGSGTIIPNSALGGRGSGTSIQVIPSPYFDIVVTDRAQAVAAPIGVRAAQGGAALAEMRATRRRRNTIPSAG